MSGVDLDGRQLRKGAAEAIAHWVSEGAARCRPRAVSRRAHRPPGGTPLVVAERREQPRVLGVIHLKDIVKGGIRERFAQLRAMGIRTVMITGDNPLTAAAIAAEAGVDDFLAEAKPEDKLALIRQEQTGGRLVAMTGDGTNDAPALAQADVGVAMNTGTQAAKEAGNMVDLDSNPTKLIEIVEIGKQMLMTRGSLTTFRSPTTWPSTSPSSRRCSWPRFRRSARSTSCACTSPQSAILSAVIFNALIIIALIPLALRGRAVSARAGERILRRNLLIYGIGGVIVPFIGHQGHRCPPHLPAPGVTMIREQLRPAVVAHAAVLRHHGPDYPGVVTGLAQLLFPRQANGSLIEPTGDRWEAS